MRAAMNLPTRPQMMQTTRPTRSRHEDFPRSCSLSTIGACFVFTNGTPIVPELHSMVED
jgi:hypothetical protein